MTLKQCYEAMGGNYDEVLGRLRSEMLIKRFVTKFLSDGSYTMLRTALAEKNVQEAFRAAHTLKGVCQNLGFEALGAPTSQLTELLRNGELDGSVKLFAEIERQYERTAGAIAQID